MWRKIVDWHRAWEDEILAVLEQPALADRAQPGYRRYMARRLVADMSAIERQQLHAFAQAYRGRRGYALLLKLVLFFSLCGVLMHVAFPGAGSWASSIMSANVMGSALTLCAFITWFNYRKLVLRKWTMLAQVAGYGVLSALGLSAILLGVLDRPPTGMLSNLPRTIITVLALGLGLVVPMLLVGMLRNNQYEMLAEQLRRETEQARLARELSESRLRLLRAQIEPHFLFNTLGAVQQLARHGAPRAAELTADLIAFLRASMGDMRSDQVSLATEFGLVESYLKVMQARLGERLCFSLALPRSLEHVRVPSMMLLTLAENAIKHGIEPALRGGEITVSAESLAPGGALRLRVRDSGVGMCATEADSSGTGLDNLRHRLRLAYGEAAGLSLHDAGPGLVAEITIPHPTDAQA